MALVQLLMLIDTEQLIFCTKTVLVDAIASLQDCDGGVIPVLEVLALLRFMIFWTMLCLKVLGMQLLFSISFNSASRQYHEVWVSQYPFLHNLKDSVPSSGAYLYGCINWSLTQAQQQSSLGLSQSSTSMTGGRTRPRASFPFNVQKWLYQSVVGVLWQRSPAQKLGQRGMRVAGSHWVVVHLPVSLTLRKRVCMGMIFLMCYSLQLHQHHLHLFYMIGHFPTFQIRLDWRCMTSNGFVLNMVKVHHLQLRVWPSLFHDFHQFIRLLWLIIQSSIRKCWNF